jgi:hypothetical protein
MGHFCVRWILFYIFYIKEIQIKDACELSSREILLGRGSKENCDRMENIAWLGASYT